MDNRFFIVLDLISQLFQRAATKMPEQKYIGLEQLTELNYNLNSTKPEILVSPGFSSILYKARGLS